MEKIFKTILLYVPFIGLIMVMLDYKTTYNGTKSILDNEIVLNTSVFMQSVYFCVILFWDLIFKV